MPEYRIFLSVVFVVRDQASRLQALLETAGQTVAGLVTDYELIVIDNGSRDGSVECLKGLVGEAGLPNLQVFVLTKEVDFDTAASVGLENALGDFVAVLDPSEDDVGFIAPMLERAVGGLDVVFAGTETRRAQGWVYESAFVVFNWLYKWFNGINLAKEAPQYRLLSKRVANYILRHPQPAIAYRHLPATGGFTRANLSYRTSDRPGNPTRPRRLSESVDLGLRLLVSSTHAPLRLAALLSLFGAGMNLVYSSYVVAIALFKRDVAPGWVSLSLQQSGMFFLISLVLLVLSEYILQMASISGGGPRYHVGQEFTSARITRRGKLNVEGAGVSTRLAGGS